MLFLKCDTKDHFNVDASVSSTWEIKPKRDLNKTLLRIIKASICCIKTNTNIHKHWQIGASDENKVYLGLFKAIDAGGFMVNHETLGIYNYYYPGLPSQPAFF